MTYIKQEREDLVPIDGASTLLVSIVQPTTLPCGIPVQNRLVKVAMYEHLASFPGGPPNEYHFRLYSEWAKHEWGMVVTGNIQIARDHLTLGRDLVLPGSLHAEELLEPFRRLADSIHGLYQPTYGAICLKRNKTLAIMQLSHAGRQSSNFIGGRLPFKAPLAPSAVPLGSGNKTSLASTVVNLAMFQTPRAMSESDILAVIDGFVNGATLAHRTGFDGVQLHAAHGYLLAQFISEKTNKRQDDFSADNALNMIYLIVERIRKSTAKDFAICIKLNTADYSPTETSMNKSLTESEEQALRHLLIMARWGLIDVIEISGGDYEKPDFMTCSSEAPRQALFARFSHQALRSLDSLRGSAQQPLPLILLTGGLRTPGLLSSALASRHADLLGIGRGSVLCPDLPSVIHERQKDPERWDNIPFQREPDLRNSWILEYPPFSWLWSIVPKIKLIGAGVAMAWYVVAMRNIANSAIFNTPCRIRPDYSLGGLQSIIWMWAWTPLGRNGTPGQKPWQRYYQAVIFLLILLVAIIALTRTYI